MVSYQVHCFPSSHIKLLIEICFGKDSNQSGAKSSERLPLHLFLSIEINGVEFIRAINSAYWAVQTLPLSYTLFLFLARNSLTLS